MTIPYAEAFCHPIKGYTTVEKLRLSPTYFARLILGLTMRRAALNKSKNRPLDLPPPVVNPTSPIADRSVNVVEALRWDEPFQTDHRQFVNTVTVNHAAHDIETHPQPHTSQPQHNSALSSIPEQSHTVTEPVIDSPMTDALRAEVDAISAIAATNATCFAVGTTDPTTFTADGFLHQNKHDQLTSNTYTHAYNSESETPEPDSNSDSDLYRDQNQEEDDTDLDSEASIDAPQVEDPWISPTHSNLYPDYTPHYHNLDYVEMSDSEGGAPLNDDTFTESHQHQTNNQHNLPEEDDDGTALVTGTVNHISQFSLPSSTMADPDPDIIMDAVQPPAPWHVIPSDNPTEPPQTPEQMIPIGFPFISNPNPAMFGSENLGLVDFLRHWAYQARFSSSSLAPRLNAPCPEDIRRQAHETPHEIRYDDLLGDRCDMQGLDWDSMNTTRRYARQRRNDTFKNYVNKEGSDRWSVSNFFRGVFLCSTANPCSSLTWSMWTSPHLKVL